MALETNDMHMEELLAALSRHNSPHFKIKARNQCEAPGDDTRNCKVMLPAWFVQQHEDKLKLQDFVVIRSVLGGAPFMVRLHVSKPTEKKSSGTYLGVGWKAFARSITFETGDTLVFHLIGLAEFIVHMFRGPGRNSLSGALTKRSSESELPPRSAQNYSGAGCSALPQGSNGCQPDKVQSDKGQPDKEDLCEAIPKKRKVAGSEGAGAVGSPTENSFLMKLRLSELEQQGVQVSPLQTRQDREPQIPMTPTPCVATNSGVRSLVHVKEELQPPRADSLPSFIQRLVKFNVQDDAGNTSGARFDVPLSFVKTHNVHLQPHVKVQGTREESSFRVVTCSYNVLQDSVERSERPPLSLGWGDFVRENALYEGQQLIFTLVSESHFVIREVHEIVIYTK